MTTKIRTFSTSSFCSLTIGTLLLLGCSEADPGDSSGSGGNNAATGGSMGPSGGMSSGGAASGGAATGGTNSGGSGTGGGSGGVGTGGASSGGTGTGGGTGGDGSGGEGSGGEGTGGAGSGGDGSGGAGTGGGVGVFMPSTGPARSMGYVGCSMSVNVAEGYERQGGERLWPPIGQYNGQVVQNWANNSDGVWGAFENAMNQHGTPEDVWVMLCIFDNMVTVEEAKQIVENVRSRAPDANILITGQPLYDDPNSCFLAGNGGPDKTDRIAMETAADSSLNIIYPGALGPLGADQNSDGCHANDNGRDELGEQFIAWFGE